MPRCTLHEAGEAIVRVRAEQGCLAVRLRDQDLCLQHLHSIRPVTTAEITHVYNRPILDWYFEQDNSSWRQEEADGGR